MWLKRWQSRRLTARGQRPAPIACASRDDVLPDVAIYRSQLINLRPRCVRCQRCPPPRPVWARRRLNRCPGGAGPGPVPAGGHLNPAARAASPVSTSVRPRLQPAEELGHLFAYFVGAHQRLAWQAPPRVTRRAGRCEGGNTDARQAMLPCTRRPSAALGGEGELLECMAVSRGTATAHREPGDLADVACLESTAIPCGAANSRWPWPRASQRPTAPSDRH